MFFDLKRSSVSARPSDQFHPDTFSFNTIAATLQFGGNSGESVVPTEELVGLDGGRAAKSPASSRAVHPI